MKIVRAHSINPDFLNLWTGQFLAVLGSQFGALAFPLVAIMVLDVTPGELGVVYGVQGLPWLLFGLFAGVGSDRFPRRPILIGADVARGLLIGWIPAAAFLDALTIEQLYVVIFLVGTCSVLFETAYQSFLPSVVAREELVDASGKLAVTESVTSVAGPSIAGVVIQITTAPVGLIVDAFSYLTSAISIARITDREVRPNKAMTQPNMLASLRQGFAYLWNLRIVRAFTLSNATFMLFFTVAQSVVFIFYTRELGLNAGIIGVIFAVGNVGSLVGAAMASRIGVRSGPGPSILLGSALRAAGTAAIPIAAIVPALAIPILIIAQLVQAFGWSIWSVHQGSTRQMLVADTIRGRVNGSFLFLVRGMTAIGGFLGAALAGAFGVHWTLVISAVGVLAGTLWLIPANLQTMRSLPDSPEQNTIVIE
ncbi:MAG: MFS transporter [Thermomicrobiales bacterium]